ncbi:hypothetical protein K458DRAFT_422051 [Lentithecium fluviatile CBS 122367]|uniref:Uncharacterized protein n=1 Tax=Lentithecium fluviatile CBS 122367 TaxID=1168545 RepID=A0A6G1IP28_9PLEO|nr:hypothetical protein K458DRAFT_422051 [Lentithecium fluviatile CBS 122367]
MAPLEIHVTGSADTLRPAERAILVLKVSSPDLLTQAEASAVVTITANTIREAITPHCPPEGTAARDAPNAGIAHYSMSTLDTDARSRSKELATPKEDGTKTTYEMVYTATVVFNIKFADFDLLNELATDFSAMQHVKIQRVNWDLTDATVNFIEGQTRQAAAANCIQRAQDFAEVFGGVAKEDLGRKVRAVYVKESNYYKRDTRPQLHAAKGSRILKIKREELRFQPEDVRLSVSVDGKFVVEN